MPVQELGARARGGIAPGSAKPTQQELSANQRPLVHKVSRLALLAPACLALGWGKKERKKETDTMPEAAWLAVRPGLIEEGRTGKEPAQKQSLS